MFGLGKKKKEEFPEPDASLNGEGKFPPAEDAFATPETNEFPSFPSAPEMPRETFSERPRVLPPIEQPSSSISGDKMEVISAKLDGIRSMIEVLNQRIINLETKLSHQEKRW